jgi:tetratricopeptide (TPR) repeat protein
MRLPGALVLFPLLALGAQGDSQPESFEANRRMAQSYLQQNKIAAALPYLEKAHRLKPADYDNGYDLALAYLETARTRESRSVIASLLESRDSAELHNLLGDVESADKNIEPAARQYETAARMDPSEKNLFDLGSFLQAHTGFEQARTVFAFASGKYPQSARLHVGLGVANYSMGQYDDAVQALCHAVDADPKDTKALDFLGKMYDISPRYADEVTKRLAHFVEAYPDNPAANYYYALSLRKRELGGQQSKAALPYLRRAVELNPQWPEAHFELGLLYEDERDYAKAAREYETAVQLKPDAEKMHYRLANLYKRMGQKEQAERELRAFETMREKRR